MKTIKNITALFEQTATETKFKLLAQPITLPAGDGSIRIKWQYQFSWPAKNPLLGDVKELINTINNAKDGDALQVLTAIKGSEKTHEVGIIRADVSTQKNRILGKDLGEFTGWIYLFYPDTINTQAIPANQKIASGIDARMTYLMGADGSFQKYFKEPGTGKPAADAKQTGADVKPATVFTAASFLDGDGPAYKWFYNEIGLYSTYIKKVTKKIGNASVPITTSGDIVPIFWKFVSNLPAGMATPEPGDAKLQKEYSQTLKAALANLFAEAAKFDKSNFSAVNIDVLTKEIYSKMAHALVVVGLNAGKIKSNSWEFIKDSETAPYYAPFRFSDLAAGSIADPSAASGTASGTATAGFDGTAVNTEVDLAKIISGTWIGYGKKPDEVDSLDKVKTVQNEYMKKYTKKTFDDIKAKLPFNQLQPATWSSSEEFKAFQFSIIGTKGTYGSKTVAGFKAGFEKSSIK